MKEQIKKKFGYFQPLLETLLEIPTTTTIKPA